MRENYGCISKIKTSDDFQSFEVCGTRSGGRTRTPLQALDFESSASTNSAIRAWVVLRDANIRPFFFTGKKTLRKGYNVMNIYCDKYKNAGF